MAEPVGEDGWLALVDEASRTAGDLEQRVGVVELYKSATAAEPWSNKLWLASCEWFWSLYTDCQNGDAGWPEEEQHLGQELFSLDTAMSAWQEGAQATQYRLNDSHELWNRWMSIELEQLAASPDDQKIARIEGLFTDRLQVPHAMWGETSQTLSTFISKYKEKAWEATMVNITKLAKTAKDLYSHRETNELKLQRAIESGNKEAVEFEMRGYLDWELTQAGKRNKRGAPTSPLILCVALFERALSSTALGLDPVVWEEYLVFLSATRKEFPQDQQLPAVLPVIQRATKHCPWSGTLWARYILCAESEHMPFEDMQLIKHAATNTRDLDRDGMGSVVEFYIAWSGYLKRLTMAEGATEDNIDVAEMGLPTALEDVEQWGQRRHGKEWKGDPLFRIERIFIQHLTQKGSFEEARVIWRKLVKTHADSYEFWQQYYLWEMTVRISTAQPANATSVLIQAINRKTLDWPEKIIEIYVRHCHNYEDVDGLLNALTLVHQRSKQVAKRREYEAAQYAQQEPQAPVQEVVESESPPGASKRKREPEDTDGVASKKAKGDDQAAVREQHLERDRENTTILVTNLPAEVTQTKVRQYFKDYGHINSLTMIPDAEKSSTTALIELRTHEEAQSALLRDGKYFTNSTNQIGVTPGTGLTLYVTNYPPTADEAYLRDLFRECGEIFSIRWPSLKFNARRRFCYISFRTAEGAAAATKLDGKSLGGVYKLSAQYSDPGAKKHRDGAIEEGRELHITSVDKTLDEDDLKTVFSKYGKVERVRILRNPAGASKGAAFVVFESKEEATASLQLDGTKLKASIIHVEMSVATNFKTTATSLGKASSASPAPDGNSAMSPSPAPEDHSATLRRTICLMNVPDTINDARIRALAEKYGEIIKVQLRPDHGGAIIEYVDQSSVGTAMLALNDYEIAPGRKLRTGRKKDLFAEKGEIKTDKIQIGTGKKGPETNTGVPRQARPAFMQPNTPVRRPGPGGRGGLGIKRGLGYSAKPKEAKHVPATAGSSATTEENVNGTQNIKPKSNADFKAMFVSGGTQ